MRLILPFVWICLFWTLPCLAASALEEKVVAPKTQDVPILPQETQGDTPTVILIPKGTTTYTPPFPPNVQYDPPPPTGVLPFPSSTTEELSIPAPIAPQTVVPTEVPTPPLPTPAHMPPQPPVVEPTVPLAPVVPHQAPVTMAPIAPTSPPNAPQGTPPQGQTVLITPGQFIPLVDLENPTKVPEPTPKPKDTQVPPLQKTEDFKSNAEDPLRIPPDAAQKKDLSFMEGYWRADKDLVNRKNNNPITIIFQFDKQGQGKTTVKEKGREDCTGEAKARMTNEGRMFIHTGLLYCKDGDNYNPQEIECFPDATGHAQCQGSGKDYKIWSKPSLLRRVGP